MTKQATTKDIENLLNEDYKETMNTIKWNDTEYKIMQQGLTWFQKYFTDEYYVLLD